MEGILVPIFMFLAIAVIFWKYYDTRNRERMGIIDKGLDPVAYKELLSRQRSNADPLPNLKWGLLATFMGIGLLIGLWYDSAYGTDGEFIPAYMLICGGAALIFYYFIASEKLKKERGEA